LPNLEGKRTFIAINLTYELKNYLTVIKNNINIPDTKIKWVNKNNFHITLKFLGYQSLEKIERIKKSLEEIVNLHNSFVMQLSPFIGCFPSLNNPRIIWVGIEKGIDNLKKLSDSINFSLSKRNLLEDKKEFSSHITIGRVKFIKDKNLFFETLKNININQLLQNVKSLELMESQLTPTGPIYNIIEKYSFPDKKFKNIKKQ